MINGKLGGNNNPRDPSNVIRPKENNAEYPSFFNNGKSNPPKASIATPDPPVNAVKKPQRKTITIGVPPGIHPNAALNK